MTTPALSLRAAPFARRSRGFPELTCIWLVLVLAASSAGAESLGMVTPDQWQPHAKVGILDRVTLRVHWHESLKLLREAAVAHNIAATERLRNQLAAAGFTIFPVTGSSPDLQHQEPGFGIVTDDRDVIVELGRKWRQEAVFWIDYGTVWLVPCGEGESVRLGYWRDRLHHPR